jgi:hypothetical protein
MAAMSHRLFVLRPDFADARHGSASFFCPDSALVQGLLSFYPRLSESIEVTYVDFPRPRKEVVALLGEGHQSCPVLVLPEGASSPEAQVSPDTGRSFFVGALPIAGYCAATFATGRPHP